MNEREDERIPNHHVAWADRIGLNRQWSRDIEACSNAFGTPEFKHMVRRFKNNIPNMKDDGPQLHTLITQKEQLLFTEGKKKILDQYLSYHPEDEGCESSMLQEEDRIDQYLYEELYRYIIQIIEDYGFGFYKSKLDDMEEKMY